MTFRMRNGKRQLRIPKSLYQDAESRAAGFVFDFLPGLLFNSTFPGMTETYSDVQGLVLINQESFYEKKTSACSSLRKGKQIQL